MASAPEPAGEYFHPNLCLLLNFPLSRLEQAIERLFGTASPLEAAALTTAQAGAAVDWSALEVRRDLAYYLTFVHETAHCRHLSMSPVGFLLWLLASFERFDTVALIRRWWAARPDGAGLSTPLVKLPDAEMAEIVKLRQRFRNLRSGLGSPDNPDWGPDVGVWRLLNEVKAESNAILGAAADVPDLVTELSKLGWGPTGVLTTNAVIEGMARCNEYTVLTLLGAPVEVINYFITRKAHGEYLPAIGWVEQRLGIKPPMSSLAAGLICDWSMQAPLLPALTQDREFVSIQELLPAWRFVSIVDELANLKVTVDDLQADVVGEVFDRLHWEPPDEISRRVLALQPKPQLTPAKTAVRKLQDGAATRLEGPRAMFLPLGAKTGAIESSAAVFDDAAATKVGDFEREADWALLLAVFLDDTIRNEMLYEETFSRSLFLARSLLDVFSDGTDPAQFVAQRMQSILTGPSSAG